MLKKIYVKAKPLSNRDAVLIEEIKESVKDLQLVRQGKLKARPAMDLMNDL